MRPWLLRLAAIALLIGLPATANSERALACSCGDFGSPVEELHRATAVFAGRVVSIEFEEPENAFSPFVAELEVSYVWSGRLHSTRFIRTTQGPTCGMYLETGEEYLVYGYGDDDEPGTVLSAGSCSWSGQLGHLQRAIELLGEGLPPVAGMAGPQQVAVLPLPGDVGSGLAPETGSTDKWTVALAAAAAAVLAGASVVAIRRRARQA